MVVGRVPGQVRLEERDGVALCELVHVLRVCQVGATCRVDGVEDFLFGWGGLGGQGLGSGAGGGEGEVARACDVDDVLHDTRDRGASTWEAALLIYCALVLVWLDMELDPTTPGSTISVP